MPQCTSRDVRPVQRVEEAREDRVADSAQPGHRARLEPAHAIADDELSTVVELAHEARESRGSHTSGRRRP